MDKQFCAKSLFCRVFFLSSVLEAGRSGDTDGSSTFAGGKRIEGGQYVAMLMCDLLGSCLL